MRSAAAAALMLLLASVCSAQARDSQGAPAPGSGSIAGVVVDETSQPVRRALVRLAVQPGAPRTIVTDADGRFAFSGLPSGDYILSASKPSHITASYGARRPGRPGTSLVLADGARVTDVRLVLARGAAISGTIRNAQGEPMPGVGVRVLRSRFGDGGRSFVTSGGTLQISSDDRGAFRVFGLEPGDYVISAHPQTTRSIRVITEAEVDAALTQRAPSAAPQAPSKLMALAPVYYPGTPSLNAATVITVDAGVERSGIDFRVDLIPTVTVGGTVSLWDGQPTTGFVVRLAEALERSMPMMPSLPVARPGPDGHFTFESVVPGDYVVVATTSSSQGPTAVVSIAVGDADLTGLALTLRPPLALTGRVVLDDLASPSAFAGAMVQLTPLSGPSLGQAQSARVDATGQFKLSVILPGRYVIRVDPPAGARSTPAWAAASIAVNGRNIDGELEVTGTEPALDATIAIALRVASVQGLLQNPAGQPTSDDTVILFPVDRTSWKWQSRRIQAIRPSSNGGYRFTAVLPGEYYLAAVPDPEPNQWFDPAFLAQILPASIRVTIAEGENKVQDLRIR